MLSDRLPAIAALKRRTEKFLAERGARLRLALKNRLSPLISLHQAARLSAGATGNSAIRVLCLIDLIQDVETILPVAETLRAAGGFEVEICLTTWLEGMAPDSPRRVRAAGFTPILVPRKEQALIGVLNTRAYDAVITASESTAAAHRFAHALVNKANDLGLATLTLQHGLENLGLTSLLDGVHEFASRRILTWGDPEDLPSWLPLQRRRRCIGIGRIQTPDLSGPPEPLPVSIEAPIVAVFENLHWERYNESYVRSFLDDLAAVVRARPDLTFVVKPHPAGRWLTQNPNALDRAAPNLMVADPTTETWRGLSAMNLIRHAQKVITTPSSVALDAAQCGVSPAVAAYHLDLPAYTPLPLLRGVEDWLAFLDRPADSSTAEGFVRACLMDGDPRALLTSAVRSALQAERGSTRHAAAQDDVYAQWRAKYDACPPAWLAADLADTGAKPKVRVFVDPRGASAEALQASLDCATGQIGVDVRVSAIVPGSSALDDVEDEFFTIIRAGDQAPAYALAALRRVLADTPDAAFAYSDEDALENGRRADPYFKGEWDPDLFWGQDYVSRLALVRTSAARAVGGFSAEAAGAEFYDLLLRLAQSGARVAHTPYVLLHAPRRRHDDAAERAAVVRALAHEVTPPAEVTTIQPGLRRVRWPIPEEAPLVSLLVPTRDRVELLRGCVEGLRFETDYPRLEIIILDNDSVEPETHAYFAGLAGDPRVRVLSCPGPFNFSAINNAGARAARGAVIGLINNDLKVMEPGWLTELVSQCLRPDVGAAGAMLYYGDGTIQHAGCVLGIGGVASHIYKRAAPEAEGHGRRLLAVQQVSSVTAACLLSRKEIYDSVGGLDENLSVAYNDIDYCLKVRAAGHKVIWTPFARLFHLESASRGDDKTGERRQRLEDEKEKMREKWGATLDADPFYSPNLSIKATDCRLAFPPRR